MCGGDFHIAFLGFLRIVSRTADKTGRIIAFPAQLLDTAVLVAFRLTMTVELARQGELRDRDE